MLILSLVRTTLLLKDVSLHYQPVHSLANEGVSQSKDESRNMLLTYAPSPAFATGMQQDVWFKVAISVNPNGLMSYKVTRAHDNLVTTQNTLFISSFRSELFHCIFLTHQILSPYGRSQQ